MLNKTQTNSVLATIRMFKAQEKKLNKLRDVLDDKCEELENKMEELETDHEHLIKCDKCGNVKKERATLDKVHRIDQELLDWDSDKECVEIALDALETAIKELEDVTTAYNK